jgi:hypothetical protein
MKLPRKAEYIQTGIDASGRTFEIRIYAEKAEEIFTLADPRNSQSRRKNEKP